MPLRLKPGDAPALVAFLLIVATLLALVWAALISGAGCAIIIGARTEALLRLARPTV